MDDDEASAWRQALDGLEATGRTFLVSRSCQGAYASFPVPPYVSGPLVRVGSGPWGERFGSLDR